MLPAAAQHSKVGAAGAKTAVMVLAGVSSASVTIDRCRASTATARTGVDRTRRRVWMGNMCDGKRTGAKAERASKS